MDGVSDICTKGGDIDFVFTGFSVNGKVWLWNMVIFNVCSVSCTESFLTFKKAGLFSGDSEFPRDPQTDFRRVSEWVKFGVKGNG